MQILKYIPYEKWRDGNPEDTVRFYALRLKELGIIQVNQHDIITQNTDWSFMESLKNEINIKYV